MILEFLLKFYTFIHIQMELDERISQNTTILKILYILVLQFS